MDLYLIFIGKCLKVGFLLSIQNGQMIHFLLISLLLVGAWLFRSLLLKLDLLNGVGWKVQGFEVKLRRISLGGDPDEAVLLVG